MPDPQITNQSQPGGAPSESQAYKGDSPGVKRLENWMVGIVIAVVVALFLVMINLLIEKNSIVLSSDRYEELNNRYTDQVKELEQVRANQARIEDQQKYDQQQRIMDQLKGCIKNRDYYLCKNF